MWLGGNILCIENYCERIIKKKMQHAWKLGITYYLFLGQTWLPLDTYHWVQSKRHRLWFSTKSCSCYSTKTFVNSVILILKVNLTSIRNIYIKCSSLSTTYMFVYVSQRSQIQFEDEDHVVYMRLCWVTTTLSSLRTTTCDAIIVPSAYGVLETFRAVCIFSSKLVNVIVCVCFLKTYLAFWHTYFLSKCYAWNEICIFCIFLT